MQLALVKELEEQWLWVGEYLPPLLFLQLFNPADD